MKNRGATQRTANLDQFKKRADPVLDAVKWAESHARQGDAKCVLSALDEYGWNQHWMMFVGDRKGRSLDDEVRAKAKTGPVAVLELGTFIGYSAGTDDGVCLNSGI